MSWAHYNRERLPVADSGLAGVFPRYPTVVEHAVGRVLHRTGLTAEEQHLHVGAIGSWDANLAGPLRSLGFGLAPGGRGGRRVGCKTNEVNKRNGRNVKTRPTVGSGLGFLENSTGCRVKKIWEKERGAGFTSDLTFSSRGRFTSGFADPTGEADGLRLIRLPLCKGSSSLLDSKSAASFRAVSASRFAFCKES